MQLHALPPLALPAPRHERGVGLRNVARAWASRRATACSTADKMFDSGALTTMTPRRVAASISTLSMPTPARPTTTRSRPASSTCAVTRVAERIDEGPGPYDGFEQLVGRQQKPHVHLVAGCRHQLEAVRRELLGDEDPDHCLLPHLVRLRLRSPRPRLFSRRARRRGHRSARCPGRGPPPTKRRRNGRNRARRRPPPERRPRGTPPARGRRARASWRDASP